MNCSENSIQSLNNQFYKISVRENIDLSNNMLSNFPTLFSKLIVRGNLDLSNNTLVNDALDYIPSVIRKSLYINNNFKLTTLPTKFSKMVIGEDFDFRGCNITKINKQVKINYYDDDDTDEDFIFIGGKVRGTFELPHFTKINFQSLMMR